VLPERERERERERGGVQEDHREAVSYVQVLNHWLSPTRYNLNC
jgi:hypothetical protein